MNNTTLRQDVAALNYEFLSLARAAVQIDPVTAALQFGLTKEQVNVLAGASISALRALANGMGCMAFKPAFRAADLALQPN